MSRESSEKNRSSSSEESLEYLPPVAAGRLNHRQQIDYNSHREDLISWLFERGKNPDRKIGLAETTVDNYAHRIDKFYRWVWTHYDGYTTHITHEHADEYIDQLVTDELPDKNDEPYSESHKRKTANAIEKLFEWRFREWGDDRWEPNVSFQETTYNRADEFSKDERRKLRDAALEYDTIPKYNDLSPDERDRWKIYLAQKLGKQKQEVSPEDWTKLNQSWKIPSLIWVSLDAGLRPVDVNRANLGWPRLEKGVLYIPKEEDAKGENHWEIALTNQSVNALYRWIEERDNYSKYDRTDKLWLNQQGNPYTSDTLNYLLDRLCETAGISQTNRKISWYSIRHSVGTYMANEGSLGEAQAQLRHESPTTTLKYDHPPPEERRDTLDNL